MRSAANRGFDGRSMFPCKPRNSIAAKPCCAAKSRIFFHSHAGHPSVEKAIGMRLGESLPKRKRGKRNCGNEAADATFKNSLRLPVRDTGRLLSSCGHPHHQATRVYVT